MSSLSIIVPALNEAAGIERTLSNLRDIRSRGAEIIVVDGGSSDGTPDIARRFADFVLSAPRGRARQMNAGAARANGDVILFLHADCTLPPDADGIIANALAQSKAAWGHFDVLIEGRSPFLRVIASMMNARSRLTGIATGDHAIFVHNDAFELVSRFPDIPLMEDIALSKALKRISPPLCLRARVTASGRRWEQNGIARTILLIWRLRLAYFFGADPTELAKRYGYAAD